MTTPYTLPTPAYSNPLAGCYFDGFTADQMHAAHQAGAASRDGEVEALRAVIKRVQHIALIDPPHTGQMLEIAAVIAAEATK